MKHQSGLAILLISLALLIPSIYADSPAPADENASEPPRVDVAVLLDTSGSMSDLIDQARTRIWNIINNMAVSKRNGRVPDLRVALYQYGSSAISSEKGHIRQVKPLTEDLDAVAEELFALTSGGSEEYCGMAIHNAVTDMNWSDGNQYRAVFIAGNEPFTQGPIDYKDACRTAIKNGIMVNTIYCGTDHEKEGWENASTLADGSFFTINHNEELASIDAPMDDRIQKLNQRLNKTLIPYGSSAQKEKEAVKKLDRQSQNESSSTGAQRALTKGTKQWSGGSWDLLERVDSDDFSWSNLDKDRLPESYRKLSTEELKTKVRKLKNKRSQIKKELRELGKKRRSYVAEKRREQSDETFDSAMKKTLRNQMKSSGFQFDESTSSTSSE